MASRATSELKLGLSVADIFRSQTIRALSEKLSDTAAVNLPEIVPTEAREWTPLTPMQEAFYTLEQVDRSIDPRTYRPHLADGANDGAGRCSWFERGTTDPAESGLWLKALSTC